MTERGRPRVFDRQAALRRAMELFWEHGYEGTSIKDLTEAMGIKPPSLYAAFESKEALFREAVTLYLSTVSPEIWSAIAEARTAHEAIERFLNATAEAYASPDQPSGCLIVLSALPANDSNAAVCGVLREQRARDVDTLRARLERAVEEGELPPGFDCHSVASFYATVQHGMSIQAQDGASLQTLLAVAECAMAAWQGLVHDTGSTP
jgi:AcrR family transcriptional regulator